MAYFRATSNNGGGSYEGYSVVSLQNSSPAQSHTVNNLKVGDKLLILLSAGSSASQPYNQYDGATCEGGTITKLCNLEAANGNARGTFYQVDCTATSITVTKNANHRFIAFKAE